MSVNYCTSLSSTSSNVLAIMVPSVFYRKGFLFRISTAVRYTHPGFCYFINSIGPHSSPRCKPTFLSYFLICRLASLSHSTCFLYIPRPLAVNMFISLFMLPYFVYSLVKLNIFCSLTKQRDCFCSVSQDMLSELTEYRSFFVQYWYGAVKSCLLRHRAEVGAGGALAPHPPPPTFIE